MPVFAHRMPPAYGAFTRSLTALLVTVGLATVGLATVGLATVCPASPAAARPLRLVAYGDSLMAGLGLAEADAFPAKLQAALKRQGRDVEVVNAGVSGDTSADGLARLDWTLGDGADAVILELGANDMLRGLDPAMTQANLAQTLAALQAKHVKVLLAGMRAPPSLGRDYDDKFLAIYPALAKCYGVPLYPFFLDGIIGDRRLHLPDQLHPTGAGVDVIVQRILPDVDKLLDGVQAKS